MRTNLVIKNRIENALKKDNSEMNILCLTVSCIASKKINYLKIIFGHPEVSKINHNKIYESILQVYLFCGFPATIESIKIYNLFFKNSGNKIIIKKNSDYYKTGEKICKKVYLNNFDKLLNNMNLLSIDLKDWMITEGYGKVLSRRGLSLKERELINVSILSTNYFEHQLYSHIKGAFNTGSRYKVIESAIKGTAVFNTKLNLKNSLMLLKSISNPL